MSNISKGHSWLSSRFTRILISSIMALGSSGIALPNLAQAGWYSQLPQCSSDRVLQQIVSRFNRAENTQWYNGVHMGNIANTHERAYNIYPDSTIDRRYCRGSARMSNGKTRRVHFVIEQGMGLAGFGWGVEYCLKGSDRWHAYGGWCRVLRK